MVGRERDPLAQPLEPDRRSDLFAQAHQLGVGTGARHIVSSNYRGFPAREYMVDNDGDTRGIGARGAVQVTSPGSGNLRVPFHHVNRQRDEHRACRRIMRNLERPTHDVRCLIGAFDLRTPLRHRRGHRDEIVTQERFAQPHPRILLTGRDDQG